MIKFLLVLILSFPSSGTPVEHIVSEYDTMEQCAVYLGSLAEEYSRLGSSLIGVSCERTFIDQGDEYGQD